MSVVKSLSQLAVKGIEATLYTAPTRLGEAWDRASNVASATGRFGNALGDWLFDINSADFIEFVRRRFPASFAQLDDGDKLIMASFLNPDALSNSRSLLGAACEKAERSEIAYFASNKRKTLLELFGRNTKYGEPPQVVATDAARSGAARWYFINGIATSHDVAKLNAERLAELFGKEFITIYNPSQGVVQDLMETVAQKFTNVNTETVARAFVEIVDGLTRPEVEKVRVVAHSQGTVVMGDVLDLVYYAIHDEFFLFTNMNSKDIDDFLDVSHGTLKSDELAVAIDKLKRAVQPDAGSERAPGLQRGAIDVAKRRQLLTKLELYLFANAASNICYLDVEEGKPPVPLIESFANEHDFVPRLGCIAKDKLHQTGLIRIDGPTFVAPGRYGHLLNHDYLRDFEAAYCSAQPLYRKLPTEGQEPYVGESLNDSIRANPCALNEKYVAGPDPAEPSNLVRLFEAAHPA